MVAVVDAAAEEVADGDSIEAVEEDVAGDTVVGTVVVVEADAAAGAGVVVVGTIPTTNQANGNKSKREAIHLQKGKV